jgi:hypothetical protein
MRSLSPIIVMEDEEELEGPDTPVEDLSVELVPVPAVSEEVAREARLDTLWELQTYTAPAPKTVTGPSFGGSSGSGDLAVGLSGPSTVKSFTQVNPMRALAPTV